MQKQSSENHSLLPFEFNSLKDRILELILLTISLSFCMFFTKLINSCISLPFFGARIMCLYQFKRYKSFIILFSCLFVISFCVSIQEAKRYKQARRDVFDFFSFFFFFFF